ncbi:isoaspartyl peptidase/L-asparaginase [Ideonella sp.]|uniref:isoaspartyl peptidase/L-asparaginase n=1 Tax=Ideonella sp. TaxID=1929293 RepID=UPI0035B4D9D9
MHAAVVTHGGTDTPPEEGSGCDEAAAQALAALSADAPADALAAAIDAVVRLERDGRYNAGLGALPGMDGIVMELDAAIMDSTGRLGAVAGIQGVRHPVRVARCVADTPHVLLVGQGATQFALRTGHYQPFLPNERALAQWRQYVKDMQQAQAPRAEREQATHTEDAPGRARLKEFWNFPTPWEDAVARAGHGTVGAVARDGQGRFAVAVSTGGSPPSLFGRVADIPLVGCGYYAGEHGAVACTGVGEHVVRRHVALRVYDMLAQGTPLRDALAAGLRMVPAGLQIGLIGVDRRDAAVVSSQPMASAVVTGA